jgi:hypothetical protein
MRVETTTSQLKNPAIMNSLILKKALAFPVLLLSMALFFASCDRTEQEPLSPEDIAQLNGRWRIISYKVDGHEYIDHLVEAGALAFSPEGDLDGQFIQVVKFVDEAAEDVLQGDYVIDVERSQLRLTYNGEVIIADVDIDGDDLFWTGTLDGSTLEMVATKRN